MFPCPSCGAAIKFNIESQMMKCEYCENQYAPESIIDERKTNENSDFEKEFFQMTVFTCSQCGGQMMGDDTDATSFCSYCGAANVLDTRIQDEKRPQCIIPFKVTKKECVDKFLAKTRRSFFMPKELKKSGIVEGFRGIYTPYYSYRISQKSELSLTSEKSHRSGDYIITDHYRHTGELQAAYAGISFDASTNFYDDISEQIAPYDVKDVKNFNPAYMAGFYADIPDARAELYSQDAKDLANDHTAEEIDNIFKGTGVKTFSSEKKNSSFGTFIDATDSMMYPVWFMSYRYGNRIGYATVNGQTGKLVMDYPIDTKKFLLLSLILMVPIFFMLNLLPVIKPTYVMLFAVTMAIAMQWVMRIQAIRIEDRTSFKNDKAVQDRLKKESAVKKTATNKKTKKKSGSKSTVSDYIGLIVFAAVFTSTMFPLLIVGGIIAIPVLLIVTGIACLNTFMKLNNQLPVIMTLLMIFTEIIAGIMLIKNPAQDFYYYNVVIALFLEMVPCMLYLMTRLNAMCLRPLPQFNKKGGDDDAV